MILTKRHIRQIHPIIRYSYVLLFNTKCVHTDVGLHGFPLYNTSSLYTNNAGVRSTDCVYHLTTEVRCYSYITDLVACQPQIAMDALLLKYSSYNYRKCQSFYSQIHIKFTNQDY